MTSLMTNLGYIVLSSCALLGSYLSLSRFNLLGLIYPTGKLNSDKNSGLWGVIFLVIGSFFLFRLLGSVGGIFNLWQNMEQRSILLVSNGYFLVLYKFFMTFSIIYIFLTLHRQGKEYWAGVFIVIFALTFLILGSRGAVAHFAFVSILTYHYCVRKIRLRDVVGFRSIVIVSFMFVVLVGGYAVRTSNYYNSEDIVAEVFSGISTIVSSQVIGRFWRNERGMLSLEYFEQHNLFYGSTYLGALFSPVPRSIWPEKPPLDAGKYALVMTSGESIRPPISSADLPNEAMPPGAWEAYWNFGIIGYYLSQIFSGLIFGSMYRYFVFVRPGIFSTILYGNFAYFGPTLISSNGLMEFVTASVFVYLVSLLYICARPFHRISRAL